jgi:lariat debranching enzyme
LPLNSAYLQKSQSDSAQPVLSFDPEWLAISRAFHPWLSTTRYQPSFPAEAEARAMVSEELEWVNKNVEQDERGDILVSDYQTFTITAPGPGREGKGKFKQRE